MKNNIKTRILLDNLCRKRCCLKEIETGKEKVRKICDVLRRETLEPARLEAAELIRLAKLQAEEIINNAKASSEKIHAEAMASLEKQKSVFAASLHQAGKQALEALRNEIEGKLFNPALSGILARPLQDSKVVLDLIKAVLSAIEKEGLDTDFDVSVPASVSVKEINAAVLGQVGEKLRSGSVVAGSMKGGVEVKLFKENITIDLTDEAVKEWLSKYIRRDFRKILFGDE